MAMRFLKSGFITFIIVANLVIPFGANMVAHAEAQEPSQIRPVGDRLSLKGPIAMDNFKVALNLREENHSFIVEKGSRFPCVLTGSVESFEANSGDSISAMLLVPIKAKDVVIAEAGSTLKGWVSAVYKKRRVLKARLSCERWLKSNAGLKLHFDRIITGDNGVIRLSAEPAANTVLQGTGSSFSYIVNKEGEIEIDYSGLKYGACGVAIQAASLASGPLSLVVGPVLSGAAGMAEPSYALDRPLSEIDDHTRVEGLLKGAFKGLPGGAIVLGAKHSGLSIGINAGTQVELELKQDLVISKQVNASLL